MWEIKRALEAGYELNIRQTDEGLFVRVRRNDIECGKAMSVMELKAIVIDEPHRLLIDRCIQDLEKALSVGK